MAARAGEPGKDKVAKEQLEKSADETYVWTKLTDSNRQFSSEILSGSEFVYSNDVWAFGKKE